jgi:hypothetical protein
VLLVGLIWGVPSLLQTDKASLLAEVIEHVKEL